MKGTLVLLILGFSSLAFLVILVQEAKFTAKSIRSSSLSDPAHGILPTRAEFTKVTPTAVLSPLRQPSTQRGYLLQHATLLQQEADHLERNIFLDLLQVRERQNKVYTAATTISRIPYPLHFFTYATDNMNLTVQRIVLQAQRSGFFQSVTALGPNDLPIDFRIEFHNILADPHGGGNFLWRFPVWEIMMQRVPLYDYALYLDAGCTILSTGVELLLRWIEELNMASEKGVFRSHLKTPPLRRPTPITDSGRKEMMRFPQIPKKDREIRWTNDAAFQAFGLEIEGDKAWGKAMKPQLFGGLLLVRNGAQWRNLTALIYKTLAKDPYIITDRYSEATRKIRPGRFTDHRHDQSISSIASKILGNYIEAPIINTWVKPPFGVHRMRNITSDQLEHWSHECQAAPRTKDEFCDSLSNTAFQSNTEVE